MGSPLSIHHRYELGIPPVGMNCGIRRARDADIEALFPLVKDFSTSFKVDFESFSRAFAALINDPQAVILVAENASKLKGYCLGFWHETLYANGRVAWLEEVMVDTSCRRSGIGERLVASFENWARDEHAVLSGLATRRASAFYEALGYEESAVYFRRFL